MLIQQERQIGCAYIRWMIQKFLQKMVLHPRIILVAGAIKKENSMEAGDRGNIHSLIFVNRHATLLTKSMIHSPRQYK